MQRQGELGEVAAQALGRALALGHGREPGDARLEGVVELAGEQRTERAGAEPGTGLAHGPVRARQA